MLKRREKISEYFFRTLAPFFKLLERNAIVVSEPTRDKRLNQLKPESSFPEESEAPGQDPFPFP